MRNSHDKLLNLASTRVLNFPLCVDLLVSAYNNQVLQESVDYSNIFYIILQSQLKIVDKIHHPHINIFNCRQIRIVVKLANYLVL